MHAQATGDTTAYAFRGGQWGVEFIPSSSLAEGGVLRFSTPTRAWVLDGSATFDRDNASYTGGSGTNQTVQSITVNARFGQRWYHIGNDRVARFLGLGVTGGYASSRQSTGISKSDSRSAGVYAELGLQYMFTRHLGLGGRGDVAASWFGNQYTQNGTGGNAT